VKEWKKQIKKEIRGMEREINQLTQAEKKIQKEIQATAKKGYDARSARAARARARFGLTRLRTRRYAGEAVKVLAREIVRTRRCKEKMCVGVRSRAAPPDRARSLTCERSKVHGPRGAQLDVDAADDSGRHRQSCRLHAEVDRGARAGGVSACGCEGAARVTILRARHARRR
jgi:hypothetical protein